jgi:transposase
MAMIIGRIVHAGSKLSLSYCGAYSALWSICGAEEAIDVDRNCYEAMDRLLGRQDAIQKKLVTKHMRNGCLVLCDITSSYMEGAYENSEIADFGYNRDRKRGHAQIVIALLTNQDGCPVAAEVFRGSTKDETAAENKIHEIREKYGLENVVFAGDRGMVTMAQYEKIGHDTVKAVSALTHKKIQSLCEKETIQTGMFDEKNIVEVIDGNLRYCLCKNPEMAKNETKTRNALAAKTCEELEKIKASARKSKNGKQLRAGRILERYKAGKFFSIIGDDGDFSFSIDEAKIAEERLFDGCCVIFTDVSAADMTASEAVKNYKGLIRVEQAFRNLKTTRLEIRPVYHKKDERIKCHVFICMLAYYLMRHVQTRLAPLFAEDGAGGGRKYTFGHVIELLRCICENTAEFCGTTTKLITEPSEEQKHILELIQVKL